MSHVPSCFWRVSPLTSVPPCLVPAIQYLRLGDGKLRWSWPSESGEVNLNLGAASSPEREWLSAHMCRNKYGETLMSNDNFKVQVLKETRMYVLWDIGWLWYASAYIHLQYVCEQIWMCADIDVTVHICTHMHTGQCFHMCIHTPWISSIRIWVFICIYTRTYYICMFTYINVRKCVRMYSTCMHSRHTFPNTYTHTITTLRHVYTQGSAFKISVGECFQNIGRGAHS